MPTNSEGKSSEVHKDINGGNNSEDSALVSIGNSSFGFNFDSEEGARGGQSSEEDVKKAVATSQTEKEKARGCQDQEGKATSAGEHFDSHREAAASAVASLQSIALQNFPKMTAVNDKVASTGRKRIAVSAFALESPSALQPGSAASSKDETRSKKKKLNNKKREDRNAREKERSFRIAKQINELRDLLSSGGVIVPKGTKSSVLTEAANYIRMLQQHQYRSEIDRQQLVQQMQMIGSGAHGPQAAAAIRQIAAQNGVWSLGNFGGVPPKSAIALEKSDSKRDDSLSQDEQAQSTSLDVPDYRFVFNSCGVAMAVASMGGAFLDCNLLFLQLSGYTKQELCALTIFNLTARQDLQQAFDKISQLISPPMNAANEEVQKPIVLTGVMKSRQDLGLSVSLVKGEDDIAKCFCVSLVRSPATTGDKPVPVSFDAMHSKAVSSSPAFTSG